MANYVFDPAAHPVGTNLETLGWTRRYVSNADVWAIAEPSAGLKTLLFTKASAATARSAISWDVIDADMGRADVECLAVFRGRESSANDCSIRVFARGSGVAAAETCAYAGAAISSNLNYILGSYSAGTSATLDSGTLLTGQNYRNSDTWLAQRVRFSGADTLWKFWIPADPNDPAADEPVAWSRDEFGNQPVSGAGWVGLIRQTHGNHEYLKFAFATGGDTATFAASSGGDTTAPTLTGAVLFGSITETSYTASWPAGADGTAVTGYEYQIGGTAGAWTDAGDVLAVVVAGRTPGVTETVYVRAYDAAGNRSTPAISGEVTLLSGTATGTITVGSALHPIMYSSASVLDESGLRATVLDALTLAEVLNLSGVTCASGVITISDVALAPGGAYHLAVKTAGGWLGLSDLVIAT